MESNLLNQNIGISREAQPTTLYLDEIALSHLRETSKWAKFLSIIGWVFLGIAFIATLLMLFISPFVGIIYLIMTGIGFIPTYYLYSFSIKCKEALVKFEKSQLNESLSYLKKYYKFMGIYTIIVLVIFLLMIIITAVAGVTLFSHIGSHYNNYGY